MELINPKTGVSVLCSNLNCRFLMGDFFTTDFQFLSSARMGKPPLQGFLLIDGRLVGAKLCGYASVLVYINFLTTVIKVDCHCIFRK